MNDKNVKWRGLYRRVRAAAEGRRLKFKFPETCLGENEFEYSSEIQIQK